MGIDKIEYETKLKINELVQTSRNFTLWLFISVGLTSSFALISTMLSGKLDVNYAYALLIVMLDPNTLIVSLSLAITTYILFFWAVIFKVPPFFLSLIKINDVLVPMIGLVNAVFILSLFLSLRRGVDDYKSLVLLLQFLGIRLMIKNSLFPIVYSLNPSLYIGSKIIIKKIIAFIFSLIAVYIVCTLLTNIKITN